MAQQRLKNSRKMTWKYTTELKSLSREDSIFIRAFRPSQALPSKQKGTKNYLVLSTQDRWKGQRPALEPTILLPAGNNHLPLSTTSQWAISKQSSPPAPPFLSTSSGMWSQFPAFVKMSRGFSLKQHSSSSSTVFGSRGSGNPQEKTQQFSYLCPA